MNFGLLCNNLVKLVKVFVLFSYYMLPFSVNKDEYILCCQFVEGTSWLRQCDKLQWKWIVGEFTTGTRWRAGQHVSLLGIYTLKLEHVFMASHERFVRILQLTQNIKGMYMFHKICAYWCGVLQALLRGWWQRVHSFVYTLRHLSNVENQHIRLLNNCYRRRGGSKGCLPCESCPLCPPNETVAR